MRIEFECNGIRITSGDKILDYDFTLKIRENRISHSNSQKMIFISKTQIFL